MLKFNKNNKNGKSRLLLSFALLLSFGILGTSTAYASNSIQLVNLDSQPDTEVIRVLDDAIYCESNSNTTYENTSVNDNDLVSVDYFFSEKGAMKAIDPNAVSPEARFCFHKYEPKTYLEHISYSDGSCTTDKHSAEICIKCGIIKVGPLESTSYYKKCPH